MIFSHPSAPNLSPADKSRLRERKLKSDAYITEAMASLNALKEPHPAAKNTQSVMDVLRREPHDPASGNALLTARSASRPATAPSATGTGRESLVRRLKLDEHQRTVAVREGLTKFVISASRPLPLTFQAERDRCFVTGTQRRGSLEHPSKLAPLFSRSGQPISEEETKQLGFLTPPPNSRKEQMKREMERNHPFGLSDPTAKMRRNEPKKKPNLHKKVPAGFVPACAGKTTHAMLCRSGNAKRAPRGRKAKASGARKKKKG